MPNSLTFFSLLRYVPALAKMPKKYIYEPWLAPIAVQKAVGCIVGRDYPFPIVDHKEQVVPCVWCGTRRHQDADSSVLANLRESTANMGRMKAAYEAHKATTGGKKAGGKKAGVPSKRKSGAAAAASGTSGSSDGSKGGSRGGVASGSTSGGRKKKAKQTTLAF